MTASYIFRIAGELAGGGGKEFVLYSWPPLVVSATGAGAGWMSLPFGELLGTATSRLVERVMNQMGIVWVVPRRARGADHLEVMKLMERRS